MKAFRNTLIFAVFLLVAVIAVKISLSGTPEVPPPPQEEVAPVAQATKRPEPSSHATPAPTPPPTAQLAVPPMLAPVEEPVNLPEDEGEHGEFTTSTDILKQKIFKKDPKLAQFDFFREHVLLDSSSREDYRKLLADKAMIEQTRNELLHPTDGKVTTQVSIKRLLQIDYLREGMDWKQHPGRADLLSEVERIILEDSFTAEMPTDIKRSLAATKMELYELLYAQEPTRAQALVEKARGTRLEAMLQYFAQHNQVRLAKERELSLQAKK